MNNMMPNGMPAPGQQANNGMQRPQSNNLMQQVHAKIINDLRSSVGEFQGSWQAMHDVRDRAGRIMQLYVDLDITYGFHM